MVVLRLSAIQFPAICRTSARLARCSSRAFRPTGRQMLISARTHRSHLSVRLGRRCGGCANQRFSPPVPAGAAPPLQNSENAVNFRISPLTQAFLPARHTEKYANFLSISQYLLIGIFRAFAVQYHWNEQAPSAGALPRRGRLCGSSRANTTLRLSFTNPSPLYIAAARRLGAAPLLLPEKAVLGRDEGGRKMKLIFFYRYILTY